MVHLSKYGTDFPAQRLSREMERLFMDKDDICNKAYGNRLAISVERSYGKFYRAFTLPATVQADKIDATYKDGVLDVNLPKEEVKPKKVTIK